MVSRSPAVMRAVAACAMCLTLLACGGPVHHPGASHTPAPTHTPSTPTPSPMADDETLQVFASGVGAYELDVNPVAVLHNLATGHTATGVVVVFTVHLPGGSYQIDSSPDVTLFPGQTLAVATTCNRMCIGATGTDVAVTVGSWVAGGGTPFTVTSPAYTCVSQHDVTGCSDSVSDSQGNVSGTVHGTLQNLAEVVLTGVCYSGSGAVLDSGFTTDFWPGGTSASMTVAVLGNPAPASCELYAVAI